jgi:cytochrome c-type biogenesis protein
MLRRSLPLLQQAGGVLIAVFGLYLLGVIRIPALMRERRLSLASRPAGKLGSVLVGVVFGAGWTPCVGPILATLLLYASLEQTLGRGVLLLSIYSLGLAIPFFLSAVALNWFLAGSQRVKRWLVPIERAAGAVMVVIGVLLVTGHFAMLTSFLAQFAPPIDIG